MSAAPTELEDLDRQIARLQQTADERALSIWSMNASETRDFERKVLRPLEELKQRRRVVVAGRVKAAEARAARKAEA